MEGTGKAGPKKSTVKTLQGKLKIEKNVLFNDWCSRVTNFLQQNGKKTIIRFRGIENR